jgi:hypothetical protein
MKRALVYVCIGLGALAFVAFDVWLIRTVVRRAPPQQGPAREDALLAELIGKIPPSRREMVPGDDEIPDVPPVRPKWLKLPPANPVPLRNRVMTAWITRPDDPGSYHDARFDWCGMIARVEYNGHAFFNGPNARHDNKTPYPVFGTAEEFGFDIPLAFYEVEPGQTFVKIGVGELVKPPSPHWYWWGLPYEIRKPGAWKTVQGDSWIEYEQELEGPLGYAYRYRKRVALDPDRPVITVSRALANRGQRRIVTSHYCHNFISMDGADTVGPPLAVEFRYPIRPHSNPRFWRTRDIVAPAGNALVFAQPLSGAVYLLLTEAPREASEHWFRVVNPALGSAVTVQGDRPLDRLAFYTSGSVVCPEPFVKLSIDPGKEEAWETIYTFEADPSKSPATGTDRAKWRETLIKSLPGP